jgi:hypothetical protein
MRETTGADQRAQPRFAGIDDVPALGGGNARMRDGSLAKLKAILPAKKIDVVVVQ